MVITKNVPWWVSLLFLPLLFLSLSWRSKDIHLPTCTIWWWLAITSMLVNYTAGSWSGSNRQQSTEVTIMHTLIQLRLGSLFLNIHAIVHLLAMLPVTTCSAERSFSTLKANQVFVPITHDNYSTDWIDTADYPPKHSHRCFGSDRQVLQVPGINAQFIAQDCSVDGTTNQQQLNCPYTNALHRPAQCVVKRTWHCCTNAAK